MATENPFTIDGKYFLFHLDSSFHSEDIWILVLFFFGLVRKRLDKKGNVNFEIYEVTT